MLATRQRKNERFTSRHKIEMLRREGEGLIAQGEHVMEEMEKLGQLFCLEFSFQMLINQRNHTRKRPRASCMSWSRTMTLSSQSVIASWNWRRCLSHQCHLTTTMPNRWRTAAIVDHLSNNKISPWKTVLRLCWITRLLTFATLLTTGQQTF